MSNIFEDLVLVENEDKNPCKGLYFRGVVSNYSGCNTFVCNKKIRLLKRKSCKGCESCGWILEAISEDISSEIYLDFDKVENGKIYTIGVTYVDGHYGDEFDYNFELYEVEEEDL